MIRPTEKSETSRDLLESMSPDVRRALERCRETFDEARTLRAGFAEHEVPIREWEEEVRAKPPKGRRWKTLFGDLLKSLSAAGNVHEQVTRREKAALSLYRKAIARVRYLTETGEIDVPPRAIELLDEVARLRSVELEWLGGVLQHSRVILSLPPGSPVDRVLILLEQRQHYMGRVGSLGEESATLEPRALRRAAAAEAGPALVPEKEEEKEAVPVDRLRGVDPVAARPAASPRVEEVRDEEWDEWLARVQNRSGEAGSAPEGEKDRETAMDKTVKEKTPEKKSEPAPAAPPAVKTPPAEPTPSPTPAPAAGAGKEDRAKALTAPFEALAKELLETVESRLSETRAEVSKLFDDEFRKVQAEHDRELSHEVRARQDAEQRGRKLDEDLKETKGLLKKSEETVAANMKKHEETLAAEKKKHEETVAANDKKHKAELEEKKKQSERMKADLDGRIANLTKEREDLKKQVADLEKADREMKAKVKANEEELAREKKRIAEERAKAKQEVEEANRERDESLVLITSLSRRLKTSGLEQAIAKSVEAAEKDKKQS